MKEKRIYYLLLLAIISIVLSSCSNKPYKIKDGYIYVE